MSCLQTAVNKPKEVAEVIMVSNSVIVLEMAHNIAEVSVYATVSFTSVL